MIDESERVAQHSRHLTKLSIETSIISYAAPCGDASAVLTAEAIIQGAANALAHMRGTRAAYASVQRVADATGAPISERVDIFHPGEQQP